MSGYQTIPEKAQRALWRAKLGPGSIVHLYCDFIVNPDNKFLVIMYIDDDTVLACLINSRIHPLIEKDPRLKACQIMLDAKTYTFLNHDSFLNCTKLFDDLDTSKIIDHLLDNPDDYKGSLGESELVSVIEAINDTDTISEMDRGLIIEALGE
jgi:hypothetical protein